MSNSIMAPILETITWGLEAALITIAVLVLMLLLIASFVLPFAVIGALIYVVRVIFNKVIRRGL